MIEWDGFLVSLRAFGPLRSRPDQAHLSAKHIPELRQLIESQLAQPTPETRQARIVLARVYVLFFIAGAMTHGAELVGNKSPPFATDALLPKNGRASARQPDKSRQQNDQRKTDNQQQAGGDHVE